MRIGPTHYRSIWLDESSGNVRVIDQRKLPFRFEIISLQTSADAFQAISGMVVRGAPLIGVTAAYGLYLAAREVTSGKWKKELRQAGELLKGARPTAVNLSYAIDSGLFKTERFKNREEASDQLLEFAGRLAEEEIERCRKIGEWGLPLIRDIHERTCSTVHILTHCNAGWLACVDYGTATAPIYLAHDRGIPVHVWVDETRPRNQGARLTAFELGQHGVPHTVITDNAGGHLMQQGQVDLVVVGSDRTTRHGDVANKIGTYLKALAADDNDIPFYVALPSSSIDFEMEDSRDMEIENRDVEEVTQMEGRLEESGEVVRVQIAPGDSPAANPGFDITPARLVTGLITERGICQASEEGIQSLFGK